MFVLPPSLLHQSVLLDVIEHLPAGVFAKDMHDEFRFVIWNSEMERIFATPRADMLGKNDYDFFEATEAAYYRQTDQGVMDGGVVVDIPREEVSTARGKIIAHTVKVPVTLNDGRRILLGILEDITENENNRRQVEHYQKHLEALVDERTAELRKLASTDTLTRLSNRAAFLERLNTHMSGGDSAPITLIYLDLDRFKVVNDTYGHDFGDQLLANIGERLWLLRDEVVDIARIGGDEFAVLVNTPVQASKLDSLCHRIAGLFKERFRIGRFVHTIDVSMGLSGYPHDAQTPRQLLQNADMAMYHAKHGRQQLRWERYSDQLHASLRGELELDQGLRRAILAQEFHVEYQPQFSLADTGRIVGLEALIRWRSQDLGLVPPDKFIPVAENTGFVHHLTDFVLETVCRDLCTLRETGSSIPRVSVNISANELNDETAARLDKVLGRYGLSPSVLTVEITENARVRVRKSAFDNLRPLRQQGLRLSIDDFGTGYSSLSYLSSLDVDEIKIDKSFIQSAPSSRRHGSIVQAILGIGEAFGYTIVAEGVETQQQAELLYGYPDVALQGYLLCRPTSFAQAVAAGHVH